MIEPHIPNVRKKKLQLSGHTIPQSRRVTDRYIIQRGQLTGRWLIQNTLTGAWVEPLLGFVLEADAIRHADELNEGHA